MLEYQVFNVKATFPRSKEVDSVPLKSLNLTTRHSTCNIGFNWWWLLYLIKTLEYPQGYKPTLENQ